MNQQEIKCSVCGHTEPATFGNQNKNMFGIQTQNQWYGVIASKDDAEMKRGGQVHYFDKVECGKSFMQHNTIRIHDHFTIHGTHKSVKLAKRTWFSKFNLSTWWASVTMFSKHNKA